VDGDAVYTFSCANLLKCWDKWSGSNRWNKTLTGGVPGWSLGSSPLIESNAVIVTSGPTGAAVDKNEPHNILWSSSGTSPWSSPVALTYNAQRSVAFFNYSGVYGRNPATGQTNWYYNSWSTSYPIADPVVYGDKILITEGGSVANHRLVQLGVGGLTSVVQSASMGNHIATPVIVGHYAYGFDQRIDGGSKNMRCLDLRTGALQWTTNFAGTLIAAQDNLIVLSDTGNLMIMKATNALTVVRAAVPACTNASSETWWTMPVLANGNIYCRSQQGTLACLNVDADLNNNSLNDDWEAQYFPAGGTNASPTADADGDGWDNLTEYIAGTNPTNDNGKLEVDVRFSNGLVVVSYPTIRTNGPGYSWVNRYYNLEDCTNLPLGSWLPVPGATNVVGDNTTKAYTNSVAPLDFYRVKVRLQ
jgi:hypothetical protein